MDFDERLAKHGYAWEYDYLSTYAPVIKFSYKDAADKTRTVIAPLDDLLHTELRTDNGQVVCVATWLLLRDAANPVNLHHAVFPLSTMHCTFVSEAKEQILDRMLEIMYGRSKQNLGDAGSIERLSGVAESEPPTVAIRCSDDGLARTESDVVGTVCKGADGRSRRGDSDSSDQVVEHS